jgi:hypothetical protein
MTSEGLLLSFVESKEGSPCTATRQVEPKRAPAQSQDPENSDVLEAYWRSTATVQMSVHVATQTFNANAAEQTHNSHQDMVTYEQLYVCILRAVTSKRQFNDAHRHSLLRQ